jgi:anti-anti-sigma factor
LEISPLESGFDARLIKLIGDLDATNAEIILEKISSLMNEGVVKFIADFSDLRYVNSRGLEVLLYFHKVTKERMGFFKIAAVNDNVKEIIDIVGADSYLEIFDTVEDAVSSFSADS